MTTLILTAALKGTIVLGAAWIATVLLRQRSADLRHRIWLAALVATALLLIPGSGYPQTMRDDHRCDRHGSRTVSRRGPRSNPCVPMVWSSSERCLNAMGGGRLCGYIASRGSLERRERCGE